MRTKMLFVCSGNLDRSPTAEALFLVDSRYEAKSAGIDDGAPVELSRELLEWADLIFVMQDKHRQAILSLMPRAEAKTKVLKVPDIYDYGDPVLVELLKEKLRSNGIVPHNVFKGKCECGGRIVVASDGDLVCQNCGAVCGRVARLTGRDSVSCDHWNGSLNNQEKQLETDVERRGWG